MTTDTFPRVRLGGVTVAACSRAALAQQMVLDTKQRPAQPRLVFSANGEAIAYNATDKAFSALYQQGDIIHADGMSLVFASRALAPTPLPERVATTDLIEDCAAAAAANGVRFFLIGAEADNLAKAAAGLRQRHPNLQIVGTHPAPWGKLGSLEDEQKVVAAINASGADVVWLGLGRVRQEDTAIRWRAQLPNVAWIKTCGGLFNHLAASKPRAPQWMQSMGLEWLHRLLKEPRRLFWRYFSTNIIAAWCLLTNSGKVNT
jgi:N-acetylglucosaminyldiphosphoundecaprenol N-acetyl-beta-D-mannosaminyltransferase